MNLSIYFYSLLWRFYPKAMASSKLCTLKFTTAVFSLVLSELPPLWKDFHQRIVQQMELNLSVGCCLTNSHSPATLPTWTLHSFNILGLFSSDSCIVEACTDQRKYQSIHTSCSSLFCLLKYIFFWPWFLPFLIKPQNALRSLSIYSVLCITEDVWSFSPWFFIIPLWLSCKASSLIYRWFSQTRILIWGAFYH